MFGWNVLCAQGRMEDLAGRLRVLVNQRFAATRCPGLSVTVARNNEIVYSTALGFADVEQAVPLSTNSVHRLASVSKPITGTIIMDLVSQGKLSLDARIRNTCRNCPTRTRPSPCASYWITNRALSMKASRSFST